jgi:hypothetical protein
MEAKQAVQNRSIGTLAERAQAHYPPAHLQCTKSIQTVVLFIHSEGRHEDGIGFIPARRFVKARAISKAQTASMRHNPGETPNRPMAENLYRERSSSYHSSHDQRADKTSS